jgi:hypothetical protein
MLMGLQYVRCCALQLIANAMIATDAQINLSIVLLKILFSLFIAALFA